MAGIVMALVLSLLGASVFWLILGELMALSTHEEQNSMLNFLIYFLCALPVAIVVVFFGMNL